MRYIVEAVVAREESVAVVAYSEVLDSCGFGVGDILARYVVGDKVDYHLHACVVSAVDKGLELLDALVDVYSDVGVDVVVVFYRIGRACASLHYMGIVAVYAVAAVIGLVGVLDYSGIPDVGHTEPFYAFEGFFCDIVHFA